MTRDRRKRSAGAAGALILVLALAGCAGGWRNGAPPGADATGSTVAAPAPAAAAAATPAGAGTHVEDGRAVFVWQGEAKTVHVAGEFNSWSTTADPLTRQEDGTWRLAKDLEPGTYAYKFVIDGSNWKEDPSAKRSVDDSYGGKNSVIVIPDAGAAASAGAPSAPAEAAPGPEVAGQLAAPPRQTDDGVLFTYAGNAQSVAVAGDFNGWSTTTDLMTQQANGAWTLVRKLDPGTYAYKFVVNGTTWARDEANPETKDDGFGGQNSVVTVR